MRHIATLASIITVAGLGITACSASDGGTGYGTTGYGPATTPSSPASSGAPTLTVMNFLGWCSVAINAGSASTDAVVTASVAPGSIATIVATPASGSFQIGPDPWMGVDPNDGGAASGADMGSGTSETSTATVTIGAGETQCVSVCCQEPGNAPTPCPTTNPCL